MNGHSDDCTIYAALVNGEPTDGICTCGLGLQRSRTGDRSDMYSRELMWADAHEAGLKAPPFTQEEWEQLWKSMKEACRIPLDGNEKQTRSDLP